MNIKELCGYPNGYRDGYRTYIYLVSMLQAMYPTRHVDIPNRE